MCVGGWGGTSAEWGEMEVLGKVGEEERRTEKRGKERGREERRGEKRRFTEGTPLCSLSIHFICQWQIPGHPFTPRVWF